MRGLKMLIGTWGLILPMTLAGCAVLGSSSDVDVEGTPISSLTLQQLEPGETTEQQVLNLLGPPSRTMERTDGEKTLVYEFRRTKESKGHLLFVFSGKSESSERRTAYVALRDGVVTRWWMDDSDIATRTADRSNSPYAG